MRNRYRATFLLLVGAVDLVYGAGLLTAAVAATPGRLHWWPGSVGTMVGVPLLWWGIIWCVIGAFLCLGYRICRDIWRFTAAAALNGVWAALAIDRWLSTAEPGSWAPASIYLGIAVAVTMISAWPDPPPEVKPPDPPELPELPHEQ